MSGLQWFWTCIIGKHLFLWWSSLHRMSKHFLIIVHFSFPLNDCVKWIEGSTGQLDPMHSRSILRPRLYALAFCGNRHSDQCGWQSTITIKYQSTEDPVVNMVEKVSAIRKLTTWQSILLYVRSPRTERFLLTVRMPGGADVSVGLKFEY